MASRKERRVSTLRRNAVPYPLGNCMNAFARLTSLAVFSTTLLCTGFAQQATPPASSTPSAPASSQDLPDSPGTQAHVSPVPTGPTAVLDTSMGRITCKLFIQQAPQTVANFIGLAQGTKDWTDPTTHQKMHNKPLYDGTQFHRVIPEFMIQGGDPTATGMGDPGYMFEDEFDANLNFDVPGRLAMANSGPNTNGSQFFITEAPTEHLNQKHTIFGQCDDSSILVVKSIARVDRDGDDKPVTPVILKKVTIVPEGQPLPPAPTTPDAASTPQSSTAKPQ
jgi:peptidyl-prolyl cis-trans isomerase A (cyclophilin A)